MSKKLLALSLCAYIGTKSVLATTMTRGEYNEYRGWQIPENEDPSERGYLVEYVDGGKPNDERHKGYISWSPADVFERSYKQSSQNQKAVTEQELAEKAVAPRVTKDQIDALMDRVVYVNVQQPGDTTSTFVHAYLDGKFFLATGFSGCVNKENFDAGIGLRLARSNAEKHAENKLWELEGYRLFTTPLQPKNHIERMQDEKHELDVKLTALKAFLAKLGTDQVPLLTDEQVYKLESQAEAMELYSTILGSRIEYDAELIGALG